MNCELLAEECAASAWTVIADIADPVLTIASIIAILLGGIWSYFNFVKGRTYSPRLETRIQGEIYEKDDVRFLAGILTIANIGLSRLDIKQAGTGVWIQECLLDAGGTINYGQGTIIEILKNHKWLEPGESVSEEFLVLLQEEDFLAVRCRVRLVSMGGMEWNTRSFVVQDNEGEALQE